MKEEQKEDVGNCSVCWKISRTPPPLKNTARDLSDFYTDNYNFEPQPENMDHGFWDTEKVFYTWLYDEFN